MKRVILAVGEHELGEGEVELDLVIDRQISYFADAKGNACVFEALWQR
jgi:hypothetical protein